MTQIIVVNDTGAQIAVGTEQTLDGVFAGAPVAEIRSASLVNFIPTSTTVLAGAATPTAITATAAYGAGNYVYLSANNKIRLGVTMDVWQILILNVRLEGELVTPTVP